MIPYIRILGSVDNMNYSDRNQITGCQQGSETEIPLKLKKKFFNIFGYTES